MTACRKSRATPARRPWLNGESGCWTRLTRGRGRSTWFPRSPPPGSPPPPGPVMELLLPTPCPSFVLKASVLRAAGGWESSTPAA
eukprot:8949136-Pyramimonas_sp.AAC.1